MKLHHIGIACSDIRQMRTTIGQTHTVIHDSGDIVDEHQNATVCLLKTLEGPDIELISGPQVDNLVKKSMTYYHLGYAVKDMDAAVEKLTKAGAMVVSPPKPAKLFNMARVSFLLLPYGLIELVESNQ